MKKEILQSVIVTPEQMLEHWQGHRNLTRRVIEAFPEEKLFSHSIGGMRPFSGMVMELIEIAAPGVTGMATGQWKEFGDLSDIPVITSPQNRPELLELWDWVTVHINKTWADIHEERFQQHDVAFGQYEGPVWSHLFYFIENEVHHRGQGYVYLRSLGIEPPFLWER
jgi:uncharacterized damage-inducible protein DinB